MNEIRGLPATAETEIKITDKLGDQKLNVFLVKY